MVPLDLLDHKALAVLLVRREFLVLMVSPDLPALLDLPALPGLPAIPDPPDLPDPLDLPGLPGLPVLLLRQYMHNTEIAVTMRLSTILKTIKQPL